MTVGRLQTKGVARGGEASFYFLSDRATFPRHVNVLRFSAKQKASSIPLTYLLFLCSLTLEQMCKLCAAGVVNGYVEAVRVCIPTRDQAMLKSRHWQILQLMVDEQGVE